MRARLNIPQHATVIVFVGRVTRDKGVAELVDAFVELADEFSTLYLLLVGPFEPELDPLPQRTRASIESDARIQQVGFHTKPEEYLAMADIFCLPSYREGFGTVVIEAGAMGLPTVATSVTGLVDAVRDGETGLLVPARDAKALRAALQALVESVDLRGRMGRAARVRAVREFDAKLVNQAVIDEYFRLSGSRHAEPCSEQ
jgi:glycosyltransferase involved in cell wall biosynthesis